LKAIFNGSGFELDTYPLYADVEEGDEGYAQNAALKARALYEQLRRAGIGGAVVADDSGLEVEALGGRPGVLSARYAGRDATWPQRRAKLLEELAGVPQERRGAKFVCATFAVNEDGSEFAGYGEVHGRITQAEEGRFGFGYDPVFYYPPEGRTFAELDARRKNALSHRRLAVESLLRAFAERA
jgi:XTP/dITP diphosphohydrolase